MFKLTTCALVALILSGCGGAGVHVNPADPVNVAIGGPVQPAAHDPPPPPLPTPDESAGLQTLLDAGGLIQLEARTYHLTHTPVIWKSGTTLQGAGPATVLELDPSGPRVGCGNDRVITTRCGYATHTPMQIAGSIAIGDTSFAALNAADTAELSAGDWIAVEYRNAVVADAITHTGYPTAIDWMRVASVNGAVVTTTLPFRVAFDGTRAFSPNSSGLGFHKLIVVENVTLQDFSVVVVKGAHAAGVSVVGSLNTTVRRLHVTAYDGQPLYNEYSKGAVFEGNTVTGGDILSEFAEDVDLTVDGNTFTAAGAAIGLDVGTGFFSVKGNRVLNSANAAIYALYGVHDGSIANNDAGYVNTINGATRAIGIMLLGSPRISVTGNILAGGAGASVGVYMAPLPAASLPDTGDVASGNTIQGFNTQEIGP